jgi:hypothetical protein
MKHLLVSGLFFACTAHAVEPSQCITLDTRDNSLADFWVNSCNQKITVKWYDQGSCRTGCGSDVPAGERSSITPVKGRVSWAACVYPQWVQRNWQGSGPYSCR